MPDNHFDEPVAARYDESAEAMFAPERVDPVVDFLAARCGDGPVLEFGIGTGRIAVPLAMRGVGLVGIDLSQAMVDRLREKPGGDAIEVVIGDFSITRVDGSFTLVYLVYNTIMNLLTQEAQVECFRNAAEHLTPGGCFVIETGVPDLQRLAPGETIRPFHVSDHRLGFDEYDVANQGLVSHHLEVVDGRTHRYSTPFRYVWPSELDLMARLAGMRLRERYGGWAGEPFTSESAAHVSVWERSR